MILGADPSECPAGCGGSPDDPGPIDPVVEDGQLLDYDHLCDHPFHDQGQAA